MKHLIFFLLLFSNFNISSIIEICPPNFTRMCMPQAQFELNAIEFQDNENIFYTNDIIQRVDLVLYNPFLNQYLITKNGFISGEQLKGESPFDSAIRIASKKFNIEIQPLKILNSYQTIFENPDNTTVIHINSNIVYAFFYQSLTIENIQYLKWLNLKDQPEIINDFHKLIFDKIYQILINYISKNELKHIEY